jgi:hypothetical protein
MKPKVFFVTLLGICLVLCLLVHIALRYKEYQLILRGKKKHSKRRSSKKESKENNNDAPNDQQQREDKQSEISVAPELSSTAAPAEEKATTYGPLEFSDPLRFSMPFICVSSSNPDDSPVSVDPPANSEYFSENSSLYSISEEPSSFTTNTEKDG